MIPLLFILLLFPLITNSCLVVHQSVTTPPPIPKCTCKSVVFWDKTDLDKLNFDTDFYKTNVSLYPISIPKVAVAADNCSATVQCISSTLFFVMHNSIVPYSDLEVSVLCNPYSGEWIFDDGFHDSDIDTEFAPFCVDYTDHSSPTPPPPTSTKSPIDMSTCKCPPIKFIDQAGIRNLPWNSGAYLGERVTTNPEVTVSGDGCTMSYSCKVAVNDVHDIVLFQNDKPPIFIAKSESQTPEYPSLEGLTCDNGTWKYYGARLSEFSLACQVYDDSCMCKRIGNSSALGSYPRGFQKVETPGDNFCGASINTCGADEMNGLVSTEQLPILLKNKDFLISNVRCVIDAAGKYDWYLNNIRLYNMAASCAPMVKDNCSCPPITVIDDQNRGTFDPKGALTGVLSNVFVWYNKPGKSNCDGATATCWSGLKPKLFAAGMEAPVDLNEPLYCAPDISSNGDSMWLTSSYGWIVNPAIGCETRSGSSCNCVQSDLRSPENLQIQSADPFCQRVYTCNPDFYEFRIYTDSEEYPAYVVDLRDSEPLVVTCDSSSGNWEVNNLKFNITSVECATASHPISPPPPPTFSL